MTIDQYIEVLKNIKKKYGNVEVYFDCPKCENSFSPNKVVALAAHVTEGKK